MSGTAYFEVHPNLGGCLAGDGQEWGWGNWNEEGGSEKCGEASCGSSKCLLFSSPLTLWLASHNL